MADELLGLVDDGGLRMADGLTGLMADGGWRMDRQD
jgi:hypothetical protein